MDLSDESDSYSSGGKGESNEYDICMNFDLSSLGAIVGNVNEGKSCSVCNFSIGSDFVKWFPAVPLDINTVLAKIQL